MDVYVKQKLREIETHAKRLYDREDFTGQGLEQEWAWHRQAVDALRNQVQIISNKANLVDEIKNMLAEQDDPAAMINRIGQLISSKNARWE